MQARLGRRIIHVGFQFEMSPQPKLGSQKRGVRRGGSSLVGTVLLPGVRQSEWWATAEELGGRLDFRRMSGQGWAPERR